MEKYTEKIAIMFCVIILILGIIFYQHIIIMENEQNLKNDIIQHLLK